MGVKAAVESPATRALTAIKVYTLETNHATGKNTSCCREKLTGRKFRVSLCIPIRGYLQDRDDRLSAIAIYWPGFFPGFRNEEISHGPVVIRLPVRSAA